jgi:transposase-like protein
VGDDGDDEEFNKELDAQVADFRARPMAEEYPFFWIDALYQKVRVEGRVVSVAVMIACGMKRTALCVSDAHAGIQAAVRKEWLGASWQRCKVHFMRNILAKVPRLTICYLVEYAEDWGSERSYIQEDKVLGSLDRLHELMAHTAN